MASNDFNRLRLGKSPKMVFSDSLLEPDVAKIFKDAATVNSALRMLAKIAQEHVPKQAEGSQGAAK